MCLDGIFYHGKTYAISALMVCGWYAIELFEYLLLILLFDAYAVVRHADYPCNKVTTKSAKIQLFFQSSVLSNIIFI